MSTQVLGDVQLVTVQEVEAMLEASVVTEEQIDNKIAAEKTAREASEGTITAALDTERAQREDTESVINDKIDDEADIRSRADAGLKTDIEQEAEKRVQADTDIVKAIDDFRSMEVQEYPNAYACRLKGLPLAVLTVHNTDKSLHVGDTIATIDEKFFPKQAVDFMMFSEQIAGGVSKTVLLQLRLDNNGNVNVIDMADIATATSATDTVTVTYFTEE